MAPGIPGMKLSRAEGIRENLDIPTLPDPLPSGLRLSGPRR